MVCNVSIKDIFFSFIILLLLLLLMLLLLLFKVPMNQKLFLFSFKGYLKKCRFPTFENSRLKNDDFTSL